MIHQPENPHRTKGEQLDWSFRQELELDWLLLKKEWRRNPAGLCAGPDYHLKTSRGEPVNITVLYFDSHHPGRRIRNYFLFGINPELGIVARKNSRVNFEEGSLTADGRLVTAYRGRGFGTAMELVHAAILQREANANGELVWVIKDQNKETLFAARSNHQRQPTESTRSALVKVQAEHERWQSIYGRFGGEYHPDEYKPEYWVRFQPKQIGGTPQDLLQDCTLVRVAQQARPTKTKYYLSATEKRKDEVEKIKMVLDLIKTN